MPALSLTGLSGLSAVTGGFKFSSVENLIYYEADTSNTWEENTKVTPASDGSPVGAITETGSGGGDFTQALAGNKPTYRDTSPFRMGYDSLELDGNDVLARGATFPSNTAGSVTFVVMMGSTLADTVLMALSDTTTNQDYLSFGWDNTGKARISYGDGLVFYTMTETANVLQVGGQYVLTFYNTGSQWFIRVNGVEGTLAGDLRSEWFDDVASANAFSIGAVQELGGTSANLTGHIAAFGNITAYDQVDMLALERYWINKYISAFTNFIVERDLEFAVTRSGDYISLRS